MRSSDWSSDVCSSELADPVPFRKRLFKRLAERLRTADVGGELFSGGVEAADVIVAIVEIVAHLVPRQAHRVRALAADRVIPRLPPVKLVAIGAVHLTEAARERWGLRHRPLDFLTSRRVIGE